MQNVVKEKKLRSKRKILRRTLIHFIYEYYEILCGCVNIKVKECFILCAQIKNFGNGSSNM